MDSRCRWIAVGLAIVLAAAGPARAQQAGDRSSELVQAASNPIADLISLPLQFNDDMGLGPYDRSFPVLNVQPVVPLAGGRVVTRTVVPFVWIPDVSEESGRLSSGLSDIVFTAFYVPGGGSLMWGVLEFPTGGSERGAKKWSAGLSGVALAQSGSWTLGVLANNVWSYAGDSDRQDVSKGLLQYFVVYQLGNGWYVNSAPILTVDWKAADGQKWKIPFGAGAGKLMFLGRLPLNVQVGAYGYVVKPDVGPDWQLRLQAQFLFPTPGG
jgi:hypothetical protein